jgi:preprotein translocase subunit SecA
MTLLKKIFGSKNDRDIRKMRAIVERINALEPSLKQLDDGQLQAKTPEFKQRFANGETLESMLPEAFAVMREAAWRVDQKRHFDVQLIGGMALHEGKIAEMKTGEGKTLTATAPLYLNALSGKGAHLVTVNDYLAKLHAEWMGRIYGFLGMTTGCILHGLTDKQRREAYLCDITYGTNNEFGFDYLRDNMKTDPSRMVQRGHNFCIVDEVDSILIDEARTPLIISGPSETNTELYVKVNAAIPGLQKDSDYIFDEKSRTVALTEDGISKLEKRLRIDNLYDPSNIDHLHHVQQAMKAHIAFKKDVDYVVRDGKVIIVDEHTGRLMIGRRYSEGLHGALEAKEHVPVQNETQTLATITFQNFFRMYGKLSGMTGTADTEAVEFHRIYKLGVLVVPTNRNMIRKDQEDVVFRTAREKFNVIADEIASAQKRGQPVLVGTVSVEKSELLSSLLKKRSIPHEILNAKNHAREAEIIALAGQKGQVTISTNMAGRGTDILLGEGVKDLGGLYVIGTERHESRRIDNQLRGRAGRQGDPGLSRFYLSLEDDLMRIFASDRLSAIMGRLGMKEGEAIESPMVTRAIARAQRRVEEMNFSSRKHLLEYDDVMNQQRQVIYGLRNEALTGKKRLPFIENSIYAIALGAVVENAPETLNETEWNLGKLEQALTALVHNKIDLSELKAKSEFGREDVANLATDQALAAYKAKTDKLGEENTGRLESWVFLQVIDKAWKNHLLAMDALKDSVSLRGYGQRDPLQEYKKEAYRFFEAMMTRIEQETTTALISLEVPEEAEEAAEVVPRQPTREVDEGKLVYRHPDAASPTTASPQPVAEGAQGSAPVPARPQPAAARRPAAAPPEDSMIYHGSRREPPAPQAAKPQQTIRRDMAKVGRNDPCPCGSGKKYKKCHGALVEDTEEASI